MDNFTEEELSIIRQALNHLRMLQQYAGEDTTETDRAYENVLKISIRRWNDGARPYA